MESGTGWMRLFFETHPTRMEEDDVCTREALVLVQSQVSALVDEKHLHLPACCSRTQMAAFGHLYLSRFLMKGSLPVAVESQMQPSKGTCSRYALVPLLHACVFIFGLDWMDPFFFSAQLRIQTLHAELQSVVCICGTGSPSDS